MVGVSINADHALAQRRREARSSGRKPFVLSAAMPTDLGLRSLDVGRCAITLFRHHTRTEGSNMNVRRVVTNTAVPGKGLDFAGVPGALC
jgi:hypothetical protein